MEGLDDEIRPAWPCTYADNKVTEVIDQALQTLGVASFEGVAPRWQHPVGFPRLWGCHLDLKEYRSPVAADLLAAAPSSEIVQAQYRPFFVEKVSDIVGLYLNPPARPW
jgi:hypothetical protein